MKTFTPTAPPVRPRRDRQHLPSPPTDQERYSYFDRQKRWPFVWLFIAQLCILYGYLAVMLRSPSLWPGLVMTTFVVPPTFVNFWLRIKRHRTRLDDHLAVIAEWRQERTLLPSVDVFLPICGEPDAVLRNTFHHVSKLEYEGTLRVHVLDDAAQDRARCAAADFGFRYLVRPNRGEWKKAGNLIHAFEATDSEFIVVFDADFCPRPDFLYETLPYMDDPRVGVVQTAQYFDDSGVNDMARYAGALQELFFRWIQPARDTYEAAIVAGTNLVYRRAAVSEAGGFAKVPLGEDVHSGVKLWVANYRTRYLPLVLAKGLAPDNWEALTNQQYRWCRSSMLLMTSRFFADAPFSLRQRVCFWAAFLYYMASAALLLTATLPTLVMLWIYPGEVHWTNYLPLLPGLLSVWVVFPRLARGWDFRIHRVCTVNSVCHLLAVVDALRNKVAAWVPTGAARSAQRAGMSTPRKVTILLRSWFVLVQTLLWCGIVRAATQHDPFAYVPAAALGLLQLYLIGPLLLRLRLDRVRGERLIDLTAASPALGAG